MNWLNIHTPVLRSPAFIGSDPIARATWLYVMAYCCEQENGGRIVGAKLWKDRQWQQTCGVTQAELEASSPLIQWDGNDLVIREYPTEKEAEIAAKRKAGRKGGKNRAKRANPAQPRSDENQSNLSTASSTALSIASTEGEGEIERKENRKGNGNKKEKGNENGIPPVADLCSIPESLSRLDGFSDALAGWIESRKKMRKPATRHAVELILADLAKTPERAVAALQESIKRGWVGVKVEWLDREGSRDKRTVQEAIHDKKSKFGI